MKLWSLTAVSENFIVRRILGKLEPFLQEKKGSKADCKQKVNSKIIQWMIFDGTSLHLVLSEPSWYSLME